MAARERNWSQRSLQFQDVSTVSQEQMNKKHSKIAAKFQQISFAKLPKSAKFHCFPHFHT